jgi:hypothetical protein
VLKVLLILFAAVLAGHLVGASGLVPDDSCCQECPDGGPTEDCPPLCAACPCCASQVFVPAAPLLAAGPSPAAPVGPWTVAVRSFAHAREIFHVPKHTSV